MARAFRSTSFRLQLRLAFLVACSGALALSACQGRKPLQFNVTVPASRKAPIDGRLLVILSKDSSREPRFQVSGGVNSQQIFGADVENVAPGRTAVLDGGAIGFPLENLDRVPAGEYNVQAVLNIYETFHRKDGHVVKLPMDNWVGQNWRTQPGNLYSTPQKMKIDPQAGGTVSISLDKVIPPVSDPKAKETNYLKYVRIQSKLLTEFWGRPIEIGSWVLLPPGFDEHPQAKYPLVVYQGHYTHEWETPVRFESQPPDPKLKGGEKIMAEYSYKFYQDWTSGKLPKMLIMTIQHANQFYDDSYAVNSANIGPYGDAITQELIPAVEQKFRGIAAPWSRVLTGGSTGGWEALGMQVFYPDFFNGTWCNCPSPVDLHAYRLVNIYDDKNAYYYEGPWGRVERPAVGNRGDRETHPANRMEDDHVAVTMEQENRLELVTGTKGRGANLWDAMQAVFSPVGLDGYPKPIWDKRTGVIDHEVAEYWREHYDLTDIMRRDWKTIGPKLVGKIHLKVGTEDQFYLANAVRYLEVFLKGTKDPYYDGEVEYGDRFMHCYAGDPTVPAAIGRLTINQRFMPQMAARILKTAPKGADIKSWRY